MKLPKNAYTKTVLPEGISGVNEVFAALCLAVRLLEPIQRH